MICGSSSRGSATIGQRAERQRGDDEERRQLRVDERRGQSSGRAVRPAISGLPP